MIEPTPQDLVDAIQAVHQSSAEVAKGGNLLARVNMHVAAIARCESVLRRMFSERELERLTGILVDMHRDPLGDDDQTLDNFMEEL